MADSSVTGREPLVLFAIAGVLLVVSGIGPVDRLTWVLEVAPVAIGIPFLLATRGRWPLTPLLYRLLFFHACILMLGGHYTYAEVPVGFWVQDWLDLSRNHYDRLGHLVQGFVPAILMREILWRASPLRGSRWLPFLVVCFALAFSASTSSSNGGARSSWARPRMRSSRPRVMSGIPSGTCSLRCAAPSRRWCC